jgi:hypothetical protein
MVTTKVLERVQAHYEVQDVEMGKVYRWHPESVVVECDKCRKKPTLTASKATCGWCGTEHRAIAQEVLGQASPKDDEGEEIEHLWRSLRPYYVPTRGT